MKLSIVIPVYNELDTWRDLLERVLAVELAGWRKQVVLVDDGSTDGTRQQLRQFAESGNFGGWGGRADFKVVFHEVNRGKGAALRTGFVAAEGDVVIVQDADLEYDPNDYPRLVEPIASGRAEVVYGSRFAERRGRKGYLRNYLANRFLTFLSNLTTRHKLTDMETCYKVFRRQTIQSIRIEQDRFGFEPEVTAKLSKLGIDVFEVPIAYNARTHEEGKKIGWKDGLKAIWCILKYGLRRSSRVRRECRGPA
jgi:glycosyltransferase involved in cell wall biosynthesis